MNMYPELYTNDSTIRTFTALYINVFEPTEEMICIEDIAHALSQVTRFGGHLPDFYSVGQHCLACCADAPEENKLEALMHDATEAYVLDMPKPIKLRLTEYNEIEENLMQVIAKKFGLVYPFPPIIKEIDKKMLELEHQVLRMNAYPKPNYLRFTLPQLVEKRFLEAFEKYKRN